MLDTDRMTLVKAQKEQLPQIFGALDFDSLPQRFSTDIHDSTTFDSNVSRRAEILARTDLLALMRAYTMHGDPTADAYAALMLGSHRLPKLIMMLKTACAKGLDAVVDPPEELVELIHEMERVPDWVDMELVEEGARYDRNVAANLMPFVERGAFIGTFINKYSALPMALTGTLSNDSAKRRIFDTSNFLMQTTLPGGLTRFSEGFKVTAMVRMMHSMVRINVLTRTSWDPAVYGMPIPQVDQMPAGLFLTYLTAKKTVKRGGTEFGAVEHARAEFARYRCFLLGLPEELLPATPQGIVDVFDARQATLKNDFDDAICTPLIEATMNADLKSDNRLRTRIRHAMCISIGKLFFLREFGAFDESVAGQIGFDLTLRDRLLNLITGPLIAFRLGAHGVSARVPGIRRLSDRILVARMKKHIARIGKGDFVSDGDQYRPKMAHADQ